MPVILKNTENIIVLRVLFFSSDNAKHQSCCILTGVLSKPGENNGRKQVSDKAEHEARDTPAEHSASRPGVFILPYEIENDTDNREAEGKRAEHTRLSRFSPSGTLILADEINNQTDKQEQKADYSNSCVATVVACVLGRCCVGIKAVVARAVIGSEARVEGATGVTEAGIEAVVIGCLAHSAAAIRAKEGAVINVRPTVRALSHFFFSLC